MDNIIFDGPIHEAKVEIKEGEELTYVIFKQDQKYKGFAFYGNHLDKYQTGAHLILYGNNVITTKIVVNGIVIYEYIE